jgi:hypothetical protein
MPDRRCPNKPPLTAHRCSRRRPSHSRQFLRDAKQHYGIGKLIAAAMLWAVQLASYNLLLREYSG